MVLAVRPDAGALSLATVFGLFGIFYGVSTLVLAARLKQVGK